MGCMRANKPRPRAASPPGGRSEVDRLDGQLRLLRATLDAWLEVQRGWAALGPIFAAPDIQRQLPVEARAFAQVGALLRRCGRSEGRLANPD
jgi:dynein heavy chain, axonemal